MEAAQVNQFTRRCTKTIRVSSLAYFIFRFVRRPLRRMSDATLDRILDFAFRSPLVAGSAHVIWHAGEPLTMPPAFFRSAFRKTSEISKGRCKVSHSIQTNGTLVDREWCDLFLEHNVDIGVSLDGPREIHDARRRTRSGGGTYDLAMKGLRLLREAGIQFGIISVLCPQVLGQPDRLFDFYRHEQIRRVAFNLDEITGANLVSSIMLPGYEKQYRNFLERMWRLSAASEPRVEIRELAHARRQILRGLQSRRNQLTRPFAIVNFDTDGNFSTFCPELLSCPHPSYPEGFGLGNVATHTLEEAAAGPLAAKMQHEIEKGVAQCQLECAYFDVCGGGAPSNKLFENGTFASAQTRHCSFARKTVIDVTLALMEEQLLHQGIDPRIA